MLVVVSYDVPDDRRRQRLAKLLLGFGARVLESVFECDLNGPQYLQLERKMRRVMKEGEDAVRVYFLCQDCRLQTRTFGGPAVERSEPFYIA
ncbi:MAG: CRISPR-associated endonuclease Cas2 [Chloroflexi bacterium]|nr:CRISPR-associated endonuclease Cas2 [Chloroflexota bacterium]